MANFPSTAIVPFALFLILLHGFSNAQLSTDYYSYSCPILLPTVRSVLVSAIAKEPRIGASLLRLFFHDCFVNGCDASILLDDTPTFTGEKTAKANNNSARGFEVIDQIKSAVEEVCPVVVSCADILAISARDSVVLLGGPNWEVKLGRRDSKTASRSNVKKFIPAPSFSLGNLISNFSVHGLSTKDLVALAGIWLATPYTGWIRLDTPYTIHRAWTMPTIHSLCTAHGPRPKTFFSSASGENGTQLPHISDNHIYHYTI